MRVRPLVIQLLRTIAAVFLALFPITGIVPPWWLITLLGVSLISIELVSTRIEKSVSATMQIVQHRALRVIADLASDIGSRFDLWVVDVYIPKWRWDRTRGLQKRIERVLSLTLSDTQNAPVEVNVSGEHPLARCYAQTEQLTWWNSNLKPTLEVESAESCSRDEQLSRTYGAVSICPIVNNAGHDSRGLLVVYTKPDPELVTTAVGVLRSSRGRRRITEACNDMHSQLSA